MPYKPPAIARTRQRDIMNILFLFFLFLDVCGHYKDIIDAVFQFFFGKFGVLVPDEFIIEITDHFIDLVFVQLFAQFCE